ncbi:MAG: Gfo/Idh/MocA family oxidoreductase [Clostridia bacterium]|nr:Gfo/Idh/MocA family oxidoreductase [Clostridia bacterium]
MKNIGIVGLGTISKYYKKGLEESKRFRLCAVCDLSKDVPARKVYEAYPFYTDILQMLKSESLDFVVVATPPATHFEVAKTAILQGVGVILEKPAVPNMQAYETLVALAKERGVPLRVMFHWQYAVEVEYIRRNFDWKKLTEIKVEIRDNYAESGVIRKEKRALDGAWLDSGVNALSMLARWLPMQSVRLVSASCEKCPESGLPKQSEVNLTADGVRVQITVDWRESSDEKFSKLVYEGKEVFVDHKRERVKTDGETVECAQMPRLESHYYNYFTQYDGEEAGSERIHKILFDANELL